MHDLINGFKIGGAFAYQADTGEYQKYLSRLFLVFHSHVCVLPGSKYNMKTRPLLMLVICFMVLPVAKSACNQYLGDAWVIYRFDNATATDYSGNGREGTIVGSAAYTAGGHLGGAFDFSGGSVYSPSYDPNATSWCAIWWPASDDVTADDQYMVTIEEDTSNYFGAFRRSSNRLRLYENGFEDITISNVNAVNGVFSMRWFCYDGTDMRIGKNDTQIGLQDGWDWDPNLADEEFTLGSLVVYNQDFNGKIDQFMIIEDNLTTAEIGDFWNNGVGCDPSAATAPAVNWGGYTPLNASRQNVTDLVFYYNVSGSNALYCELYNATDLIQNSSAPLNVGVKATLNHTGLSEGLQTEFISCYSAAGSGNSTNKYITIDTTPPNPTITGVSAGTTYYNNTANRFIVVNSTDETGDLYDLEVNLSDDNGNVWYHYVNGSLGTYANWTKNLSINMTGEYTLFAESCDSASIDLFKTKKKLDIEEWPNKIKVDHFLIEDDDGDAVSMVTEVKRWGVSWLTTYDKLKKKVKFMVTSDCPLTHLSDSKYPAHLVSRECKQSIEFSPFQNVELEKINDYKYRVIITHDTDKDKTKIESVHYLNCQNISVAFSVLEPAAPGVLKCYYDQTPYLDFDFPVFCWFNQSTEINYNCVAYTYFGEDLVTSTPEPKYIEGVGSVVSFASHDRLLNVRFSNDYLRENFTTTLKIDCQANGSATNWTANVTPHYKPLYSVIDTATQLRLNAGYYIGFAFSAILLFLAAWLVWRITKP